MKNSFLVAWQFLTSLSMVFIITFVIFPGVLCDTNIAFLKNAGDARISWNFLIFILTFNIFDTVGRFLGGQSWAFLSDRAIFIVTYSRIIFMVTGLLIAYNVAPSWLFGADADWFKIINMALFALSNGYCSTQCAIKAPSRAPDDSKESVGTFIGVFITLGIVMGSIIAIGMGKAIPDNLFS